MQPDSPPDLIAELLPRGAYPLDPLADIEEKMADLAELHAVFGALVDNEALAAEVYDTARLELCLQALGDEVLREALAGELRPEDHRALGLMDAEVLAPRPDPDAPYLAAEAAAAEGEGALPRMVAVVLDWLRRPLVLAPTGLLAAALLALVVVDPLALRGPALPAYEASWEAGAAELRSEGAGAVPGEEVALRPGDTASLVLRPETARAEAVQVHTFLRAPSGELAPAAATVDRAEGGFLELSLPLPADQAPGAWELIVVLGPGSAGPGDAWIAEQVAAQDSVGGWTRVSRGLEVLAP